jgi:23S rRNA pseudouridine2457 synthase
MKILRFYKPFGVLTKFTDAEGRPTLANYVSLPNVYPAGRLDMDSEGLLLLTDWGVLNQRLTDPRFAHPRTYLAQVERIPSEDDLRQLCEGVIIEGQKTRPALVRLLKQEPNLPSRGMPIRFRKSIPTAWIELTLTEGRNRQVRRMTAAVGHPTLRLVRIKIGKIGLTGLQPGEWQFLTPAEVISLRRTLRLRGELG